MRSKIPKEILSNLVVLLIDMQDSFINSEEKRALIFNQIKVIEFCKKNDVSLIIVEYENNGNTTEKLSNIIDNLNFEKIYKITKTNDSAFVDTDLNQLLASIQAKTLLITGINACACVWKTAKHAVAKGYNIITSKDLIAGYCINCSIKNKKTWYRKNAFFPDNYKNILELMQN